MLHNFAPQPAIDKRTTCSKRQREKIGEGTMYVKMQDDAMWAALTATAPIGDRTQLMYITPVDPTRSYRGLSGWRGLIAYATK